MRILLVEDEKRLADALEYIIRKNKYAVDVAYDGISAQDMAESGVYDLIVLDRMLPGKDGVDVLKALRGKGMSVPVIFLTAKDSVVNRIEGLDAGADDYLIKPFSTDELMARIRALCRRSESLLIGGNIEIGNLKINPTKLEVTCAKDTVVISVKEMQLLELLARNKGQTLSKEQIFERVWGYDSDAELASVELYIHYLRKKIANEESGVQIKTIRGVGYCILEETG